MIGANSLSRRTFLGTLGAAMVALSACGDDEDSGAISWWHMAPALAFYAVAERQLVGGLASGATKG